MQWSLQKIIFGGVCKLVIAHTLEFPNKIAVLFSGSRTYRSLTSLKMQFFVLSDFMLFYAVDLY